MNKNALDSLFSKESLLSLQGCAAVTLLVPNVLAYLIGSGFAPYQKWVAFGVAMLLALYVASQAPGKAGVKWVLAVLNGFLIFASAVGLTTVLGSAFPAEQPAPRSFFGSWYK